MTIGSAPSVEGQYCRAPVSPGSRISSTLGSTGGWPARAPARRTISRVPATSREERGGRLFCRSSSAATSGSSGTGIARELREDLAIERRMRLPRLCGYDSPVAHGLLVHKRSSGLLRFQANVLIAGHPLPARQPCRSQYLDAMANGEDPFPLAVELTYDLDHPGVVAQVLRRPAPQDEHRSILLNSDILEPMHGVERLIRFSAVASNDQDLGHLSTVTRAYAKRAFLQPGPFPARVPAVPDAPPGPVRIGIFGQDAERQAALLAPAIELYGGRYALTPVSSDAPWGKASSALVTLIYEDHALALVAGDRNSSHLAEQIAVKAF